MGIIDSLSTGYRFTSQRPYLLIIPILLDLALWNLPRLSIAPLLERLAEFYTGAIEVSGLPTEITESSMAVIQAEDSLNLLDMLVNRSLMHVPSIMVLTGVLPEAEIVRISNASMALLLFVCFSAVGLYIGILYMGLLSQNLPIGEGQKVLEWRSFMQTSGLYWLRLLTFVVALFILLVALYIPISIVLTLAALVNPALSSILLTLLVGLTLVLFFYLYFVSVGVILDDLPVIKAINRSFTLTRKSFWSTIGFILLTNLITAGFNLLAAPLAQNQPIGLLVAILLTAYIGTGLAMALLVYYRTQLLKIEEDILLKKHHSRTQDIDN